MGKSEVIEILEYIKKIFTHDETSDEEDLYKPFQPITIESIGSLRINKERNIVIGAHGWGRNYHDWDKIHRCPRCRSRHVWMENENKRHTCEDSRKPVRIRCLICRKKTEYGEFYEVRKIWSNGKDNFRRLGDNIQDIKLKNSQINSE